MPKGTQLLYLLSIPNYRTWIMPMVWTSICKVTENNPKRRKEHFRKDKEWWFFHHMILWPLIKVIIGAYSFLSKLLSILTQKYLLLVDMLRDTALGKAATILLCPILTSPGLNFFSQLLYRQILFIMLEIFTRVEVWTLGMNYLGASIHPPLPLRRERTQAIFTPPQTPDLCTSRRNHVNMMERS